MLARASTEGAGGRRRKRWLAAGAGLVGAFVVLELVARVMFGAPLAERTPILVVEANPHRGFSMVPDQEHYTYLHRTRTNELGLRGPPLGPRVEGRTRILFLGDSLVYGQGVADEDTVGAHLERALAAAGRDVEVVNGGVRAYATHQELGLLEELGDRIAPDVVVLGWYWNDIFERDLAVTYEQLTASGPVAFDMGAPMKGATWWRWQAIQVARASALVMELHDRRKALRAEDPPQQHLDQALERLDGYLDRFVAWCAERDVEFVVVVLPEAALAAGREHLSAGLQSGAVELARSKGIPTADLTPAMRARYEATGKLPVLAYDGHYDGEGNRVLAEALAQFLTSQGAPLAAPPAPPR